MEFQLISYPYLLWYYLNHSDIVISNIDMNDYIQRHAFLSMLRSIDGIVPVGKYYKKIPKDLVKSLINYYNNNLPDKYAFDEGDIKYIKKLIKVYEKQ
jgi:hypothetical protein